MEEALSRPADDVAVIVVNYNSSGHTTRCVESIRRRTGPGLRYRIVVVDNNSAPEDFARLGALAGEDLRVIRSRRNGGFSAGNMLGVDHAHADYYYFLNNDTLLLNDVLGVLHGFMERRPDAGLCSGQMHDPDERPLHNFTYAPGLALKLVGPSVLRHFTPERYPSKRRGYDAPLRVPVLNGSSMFVRAAAFDAVGGFDPTFFLYCEEEDLALRLGDAGYSAWLVPEARYVHLANRSTPGYHERRMLYRREYRISEHYLFLKHFGRGAALVWRVNEALRSALRVRKDPAYLALAWFILRGPHPGQSLGRRQELGPADPPVGDRRDG